MVAPELAVALNITVPAPHLEPGVVPVIVGRAFTVNVAGLDVTEPLLFVTMQR